MIDDHQLEQLLRKAPAPPAPFGMRQRLIQQARRPERKERPGWTWFGLRERNWAPAAALSLVMVGLIAALAFQQSTLNELKARRQELLAGNPPAGTQPDRAAQSPLAREFQQLQKQSTELEALRAEMTEIEKLITQLPQISEQNRELRAELAALTKDNPAASPEVQASLTEAREKAGRIRCVNNLKNVGLGARIWATDNGDNRHLPIDFATMKNELNTPRILVCPVDTVRSQALTSWEEFAAVGSSYEILSPGISENVPSAVYARCPIHNNVVRADGSVWQLRPDQQLVQRNGFWEIQE